jgi:acetyl esterase
MLALGGQTDPSRMTVSGRRQAFQNLMKFSEQSVPIGRVEDRSLPGPEGPIGIRVYTPAKTSSDRLPGLVYFHGGGLVAGSLDTHEGVCRALANESGCRIVSVDYRLAPEHPFPAAVMDARAALLWVLGNAGELALDRDRIGIGGDSAGGTLAAVSCQMAREIPGLKLGFQLLLCPIMDFAGETESRRAFSRGYLLDESTMDRDLECYVPAGIDVADPRISPLRSADFRSLPPAYIHTAEFDPLRDEGEAYADGLRLAVVEVVHTCHPGMTHLFYGMTGLIPYARSAMKAIGAQIRAAVG